MIDKIQRLFHQRKEKVDGRYWGVILEDDFPELIEDIGNSGEDFGGYMESILQKNKRIHTGSYGSDYIFVTIK